MSEFSLNYVVKLCNKADAIIEIHVYDIIYCDIEKLDVGTYPASVDYNGDKNHNER